MNYHMEMVWRQCSNCKKMQMVKVYEPYPVCRNCFNDMPSSFAKGFLQECVTQLNASGVALHSSGEKQQE